MSSPSDESAGDESAGWWVRRDESAVMSPPSDDLSGNRINNMLTKTNGFMIQISNKKKVDVLIAPIIRAYWNLPPFYVSTTKQLWLVDGR